MNFNNLAVFLHYPLSYLDFFLPYYAPLLYSSLLSLPILISDSKEQNLSLGITTSYTQTIID